MAEVRMCAQCGTDFTPQREHARFCSVHCRMTWNREHAGVAAAPVAAIDWSVTAMNEAAARLAMAGSWELPRAAAVVGEAVWWVTLVDATLVRYHPRGYESALACKPPARRRKTEETLAGLRYVRNRLGRSADPAELIRPAHGGDPRGATGWKWRSLPEPALAAMPPGARTWEMTRYQAYQARLADRDVARIFARCTEFLQEVVSGASAAATALADADTASCARWLSSGPARVVASRGFTGVQGCCPLAQPWAMASPSVPSTVTHQRVRGWREAARAAFPDSSRRASTRRGTGAVPRDATFRSDGR
jgi:hypothetical protein